MTDDDSDKERSPEEAAFGPDNLYHTAYVVKDYPHEVSKLISIVLNIKYNALKFVINRVVGVQGAPPCCKQNQVDSLIQYVLCYRPRN